MTRPNIYLIRMAGIPDGGRSSWPRMLSPVLLGAYANNPMLNSLILLVLLLGIAWNLRQVLRLSPEVVWVETFQNARAAAGVTAARRSCWRRWPACWPRARRTARTDQARFTLSATAMRSLLDGIASRLDESRELSRYMTGLMIFLGLLGTFWGLLKTIGAVSDVIGSMSVGSGDLNALFEQLKSGLAQAAGRHGHRVLRLDVRPVGRAGAGVPRPDRGPGAEPLLQRAGGMAGRA